MFRFKVFINFEVDDQVMALATPCGKENGEKKLFLHMLQIGFGPKKYKLKEKFSEVKGDNCLMANLHM